MFTIEEATAAPPEVAADPKLLALPTQAEREVDCAKALVIDSPEMAQIAADSLGQVSKRRKAIEEQRLALTRPMDEAKRRVMEFFGRALDPLTTAEGLIRGKLSQYHAAERERVARELRQQQEAAALERRQREEEAARARQAEQDAQAEAERLAQEAAATGSADAARAAEEAAQQAQAAAGATIEAEAEADAATFAPPVVVRDTPKVSGASFRGAWKAECVDLAALITAAATNPQLHCLLKVDTTALGQVARAQKGAVAIPGIRFYQDTVVSVRRA
jgi:hypothetical protein